MIPKSVELNGERQLLKLNEAINAHMTPVERVRALLARDPYNRPIKDDAGVIIPQGFDAAIQSKTRKEAIMECVKALDADDV